jgi:hypothetical protein
MTSTNVSTEVIQPKESVVELLSRAKLHIETGYGCLQQAAEDIAAAREQGATQHQIAETVGKSQAWVSGLLKWRKAGYPDTAFGPQAKKSRNRRSNYQATNNHRPASVIEPDQCFADDERDQRDAEARKVIARLRKDQPDNEDVMFLCDYIEGDIAGAYRPVVQQPDETAYTH